MERGKSAIRLRNKYTFFYEIVNKVCIGIEKKEDKITYLKKIIKDCDRIIELSEIFDEIELSLESIKKEFVDIDENFYWLLDEEQAGPPLTNIFIVREPQSNYMTFELDKLSKNNPNFKIDGIKKIKMHLEFDCEKIAEPKNEKDFNEGKGIEDMSFAKIIILTGIIDIVRIFESMMFSGIISKKTPTQRIANLFFTEVNDKIKFEDKYNSARSKIRNYNHTSNSNELVDFVKRICEISFRGKNSILDELIGYLEKLQKFAI